MVFLVLLALPLLVVGVSFIFSKGLVTPKELALQIGVQILVAGVSAWLVHWGSVHDTEVWNGLVRSKKSEHVNCSHSYDCNCSRDSKGHEHCDTCYRHLYDVDWNVYTSNPKESVEIERLDEQGIAEPPRFTRVRVGEPTTIEHSFTNYIKAAPGTLFRHQGLIEKFAAYIPSYPKVYDYYRIHRVVLVNGANVPDYREWDDALSQVNAEVGRPRQANVIVVLARNLPQEYFFALEEAWIGGKKNDIVLVVGTDDALVPQWATVMCWTTQEIFKVKLRDDIMDREGTLTSAHLMNAIKTNVTQSYVRKPMADFEYLEASITPTPAQWSLSLFAGFTICIVLTIVCIKKDLFGDERRSRLFAEQGALLDKLGLERPAFRSSPFGRRRW